jgi:2-polyprenyl-3-methyl-5-hydroxy-6-metoxy-1,4-benzoquinol methylase
VAVTNTGSWDRVASGKASDPPIDVVRYGPDGPTEYDLRLLGNVAGKRVLDLGCGVGQAATTFAVQGATVIAVDESAGMIARARRLAEQAEVRVEWHQGDLADLAFLRADSIDIAFSAFALSEVEDLSRVLRQVHRVLKNRAAFAFSYEHPMGLIVGREPPATPATRIEPMVRMSYFAEDPVTVERGGEQVRLYVRTLSDVFQALTRAGFRVELIVEPLPSADALVPRTIVWRARKEGV